MKREPSEDDDIEIIDVTPASTSAGRPQRRAAVQAQPQFVQIVAAPQTAAPQVVAQQHAQTSAAPSEGRFYRKQWEELTVYGINTWLYLEALVRFQLDEARRGTEVA